MYDYLVVGSGLYGAVFAQQAKAAGNTKSWLKKKTKSFLAVALENINTMIWML